MVLLARGVMGWGRVMEGEGDHFGCEFTEDVEEDELDSCNVLMTSCILSP